MLFSRMVPPAAFVTLTAVLFPWIRCGCSATDLEAELVLLRAAEEDELTEPALLRLTEELLEEGVVDLLVT